MSSSSSHQSALEFLEVAHLYRLGHLPTEMPHPETRDLSMWARHDPATAVSLLHRVDVDALGALEPRAEAIEALGRSLEEVLADGGRVFLCGCGATGRLALTVESLWRHRYGADDRVIAFTAGGDVALVHALERFEDRGDWGGDHLRQLGFTEGDVLVACTEGGETPFVLGAVEAAVQASSRRPWLLFCNPESALSPGIERFRRVRENRRVHAMCLDVGPMALAGSTRMQASTVLQLAVGIALLHPDEPARQILSRYREHVIGTDFTFLGPFIEAESAAYAAGDRVSYRVREFGITVFTDTTERAPTFSLVPFDQLRERRERHSLCYIVLDEAASAKDAWQQLLNRAPKPLEWPEIDPRTSADYLRGFDFSARALERRRTIIAEAAHLEFSIGGTENAIELRFDRLERELPAEGLPDLLRHTLLKQALNIHSTLTMGRLGRYEGNLMTWVRPTNGKLVDRSARYVQHLLARAGRDDFVYEDVIRQLFVEIERSAPDEPVVLRTFRTLTGGRWAPRPARHSAGEHSPLPFDRRGGRIS